MVTALDTAIGEVVRGLQEAGLWNNTLLFFSNDNGRKGGTNYRGGKNDFYQGGVVGNGFFAGPFLPTATQGATLNHLT